jgi:hypothetical protein
MTRIDWVKGDKEKGDRVKGDEVIALTYNYLKLTYPRKARKDKVKEQRSKLRPLA